MKKQILAIILLVFTATYSQAQLSDADAKAIYEEAEKNYEDAATIQVGLIPLGASDNDENVVKDKRKKQLQYQAAQLCESLHTSMGRWTPKTLYLYLQSWSSLSYYSSFFQKKPVTEKFYSTYDYYKELYDLCDTLFATVGKNYPSDKIANIQKAKKNFENQMNKFEFERGANIENALAFLNLCAQKFPKKIHFDKPTGKKSRTVDELIQWKFTFTDNRYLNFFAPQMPDKPAVKIDMAHLARYNPFMDDGISSDGQAMATYSGERNPSIVFVDNAFLYYGRGTDKDGYGIVHLEPQGRKYVDVGVKCPFDYENLEYKSSDYETRISHALFLLDEIAHYTAKRQEVKQQYEKKSTPVKKEFGF